VDTLNYHDIKKLRKKFRTGAVLQKKHLEMSEDFIETLVNDPDCFVVSIGRVGYEIEPNLQVGKSKTKFPTDVPQFKINARSYKEHYNFWKKEKSFIGWKKEEVFHLNSLLITALSVFHILRVSPIYLCNIEYSSFLNTRFERRRFRNFLSTYLKETDVKLGVTSDDFSYIFDYINDYSLVDDNLNFLYETESSPKKIDFEKPQSENLPTPSRKLLNSEFSYPSKLISNHHTPFSFEELGRCAVVLSDDNEEIDLRNFNVDDIIKFNNFHLSKSPRRGLRFISKPFLNEVSKNYVKHDIKNQKLVFQNLSENEYRYRLPEFINKNELYFFSEELEKKFGDFERKNNLNLSFVDKGLIFLNYFANSLILING